MGGTAAMGSGADDGEPEPPVAQETKLRPRSLTQLPESIDRDRTPIR